MLCPVCKNTQLVMTERKSIEIDYCPSCRGVWLDRGELDKIIEKASEELATVQPSQPHNNASYQDRDPERQNARRDYNDRDYERRDRDHSYKHKKKSFWMELFD